MNPAKMYEWILVGSSESGSNNWTVSTESFTSNKSLSANGHASSKLDWRASSERLEQVEYVGFVKFQVC